MSSVLVVGAGPVGLTMAAELARHGVRCRIIDTLTTPSRFCRALGVTPRTLEVWEDMGIVREAIDAGLWLKGMRLEIEGQPRQDFVQDLSDLPFSALSLPQNETERILAGHLKRFSIEVERGVSLTAVSQAGDTVSVTLEHDEGQLETTTFRYVIGCDGAHSAVRRQAGIGFTGEAMPYDFMLGDVHIDWDLPRGFSFRALRPVKDAAPDIFVAVPLPEMHRYRVTMLAAPNLSASGGSTDHGIQSERPAPSLEHLQAAADRIVARGPKLTDLRWSSLFRISMRLADKYREKNLFLAGDAAHIHPPTGGQGMNTGIQDAYNLAWKMALVLQQAAPVELLDSYEKERRAEGEKVIQRTVEASMKIADRNAKPDRLADTQINVSYNQSVWVQDESPGEFDPAAPAPGQRAPDCQGLLRDGLGFPLRLFDILRGTDHVLLVDVCKEPQEQADKFDVLAARLHQEFGRNIEDRLRIVLIGAKPPAEQPPTSVIFLHDPDGIFAKVYGPRTENAYLIRPDGYIGWRGTSAFSPGLLNYLRKIFRPATS